MKYFLLLFFLYSTIAFPQNSPDGKEKVVRQLSDSTYQIGNIILNSASRQLTMPGRINMDAGVIELLACAPGGKVHESILVIDVIPFHLQVSLILLGLNYGGGVMFQGDSSLPQGDYVDVFVSWTDSNGTAAFVRSERLIYNLRDSSEMQYSRWVFTGSKVVNGLFMADMEKSLITTYHDPFTILDNPSPDGAYDDFFIVNKSVVPPKGTPVTLIIKADPKNK